MSRLLTITVYDEDANLIDEETIRVIDNVLVLEVRGLNAVGEETNRESVELFVGDKK